MDSRAWVHKVVLSFAVTALLYPLSPNAQTASQVAPNAGSILQQIQPVIPQSPSSPGTGLTIERGTPSHLPASAPFEVKTLRITGNTVFDLPTLHALVAKDEGQTLTLPQLDALAERITEYYRDHGYMLTRAIIPAQTIEAGVVRIEVIEARYGKIVLENQSRVDSALLQEALAGLSGGAPINQDPLDHALLLLADVPGMTSGATLKPGEAIGTSDLLVEALPGASVLGNAVLDNYGNRYTGRIRIGATLNYYNPLQHGDVLSFMGLSSGSGMNYGRIGYDSLLNGRGTHLGVSYSNLYYVLGGAVAALNGHGTAEVASVWAKHPFLRGRELNVNGEIQYEQLKLRDHIDASGLRTDRHLENWTLQLSGDARDGLFSGGVTSWNLGRSAGRVGFDDSAAQLVDAATANTQAGFSKWNASLSRWQGLSQNSALYLSLTGQRANTNLDASKKMVAGGNYSVRAYDVGATSGDSGYVGSAELRHELGEAWSGRWQAVVFIDSAHVQVNKSTWAAGTNNVSLRGAGLGLNWTGPDRWSARAYVATPMGTRPASMANTASVRAWVEIGKGF